MPLPAVPVFAETYQRLDALLGSVTIRYRPEPPGAGWARVAGGWVNAAELDQHTVLDGLVAARRQWLEHEYQDRPRAPVAAASALHRYLWLVCLAIAGPFLLARRVPRLAPDAMAVPVTLDAITVAGGDFACLPGDRPARHAGARAVPHLAALRQELRSAVAKHTAPVLAAFGPKVRRGETALRATVTDQLAAALWQVGQAMDEEHHAVTEAHAILPHAGGGFRRLDLHDGRHVLTRTRRSCCLHYTLRDQQPCLTCPRLTDADRIRRLATH